MTPAAAPRKLTHRQRAVYDAILAGPRGNGFPFALTAADGSLVGPFGLMVRFPEWGAPLQSLGAALRFESILPDRAREIAILTVAGGMHSPFEVQAHTAVGLAVGLREDEIAGLLSDVFAPDDVIELAVLRLTRALLTGDAGESGPLDERQTAEVIILVGYYRLLAQLMSHFDVVGVEASR